MTACVPARTDDQTTRTARAHPPHSPPSPPHGRPSPPVSHATGAAPAPPPGSPPGAGNAVRDPAEVRAESATPGGPEAPQVPCGTHAQTTTTAATAVTAAVTASAIASTTAAAAAPPTSPAVARGGGRSAEPGASSHSCCRPWNPWRDHQSGAPRSQHAPSARETHHPGGHHPGGHQLARGIGAFQRHTAPLVRGELARLAREGQQPSQLFLTCADSRLVTSMITASGPGDLFVVRNVGNLVPVPGAESGDDSVAAAIEYAVDVLKVRSVTICGHSGCGAMQALLSAEASAAQSPLRRWLRHGAPSLERMASTRDSPARLTGRAPADSVEQLCLTNVVQQLAHLRAHESVARRLADGSLTLDGMYFHVGEAQAYLLDEPAGAFTRVNALEDTSP